MVGHDSKGSVEQSWAALGVEIEAKSASTKVPDRCWPTPEDGWAALAAEMDSAAKAKPLPSPPQATSAIPSFEAFVASKTAEATSAQTAAAALTQPTASQSPCQSTEAIPSFEEFKAAHAANAQGTCSLLAMRNRDPSAIESGWAALGAELDNADATYNSVEDGWAALGAELDARPPATWAELGGEDAARRAALRTANVQSALFVAPAAATRTAQHSEPA